MWGDEMQCLTGETTPMSDTTQKKIRQIVPVTPADSPVVSALKLISGESKDVPLMSTNLQPIRYLPTIFSSFNRASVIGGAPIRCTYVVHGKAGGGKTAFAVGLVNSFTRLGHFAGYIDAEHAVDKKWFLQLGADPEAILFEQPDTFEETIALVDKWTLNFKKGKAEGHIPQDKAFIIVVDTIHKLVPKRELAQLLASGPSDTKNEKKITENIDKGWGRLRANLISVWIDKMTPIVGKNDIAFVMLAHEHELQTQGGNWNDPEYKVKGGQALLFEAMVRVRVTPGSPVMYQTKNGGKIEVGHTSNFTVEKNKVGYPHEAGVFFTSNGKGPAPIGFDLAREAFTEGVRRGVITLTGAWYNLPDGTKHQGEEQTLAHLRDNPDGYQALYDALLIKSDFECV